MACVYVMLKIKVELSLGEYLSALIEMIRWGEIQADERDPIRIAGEYFRKKGDHHLLRQLKGMPGFLVEDAEVIYPAFRGQSSPSQIIIPRQVVGRGFDLAYGEQAGETVVHMRQSGYQTNAFLDKMVRAGKMVRMIERLGSKGYRPTQINFSNGDGQLSGRGGTMHLRTNEDGSVEVWAGEAFANPEEVHDLLDAVARGEQVIFRGAKKGQQVAAHTHTH